MRTVRLHLLQHRWLCVWLVGLALLMRLAVPAGYMPSFAGQAISIAPCAGQGPVMTMPGMADHHDDKDEHGKSEPCGFAGLSIPSLAGADPLPLVPAIGLPAARAFESAAATRVTPPPHLRPPLRGPPTSA